ncbi:MAG: serine hydrolase [Christensenellales bacterium]
MGKRLAGTLLAVVLLICFGAAYGEEYPVDVSGMKAAVLCSQDGQSIIEYNSAERLEVGGLGRLPLLLAACDKIDGGGLALTDKVTVSREAARVPGPTAFLDAYENAEVSMLLKAAAVICAGDAIYALGEAAYGYRGLRNGSGRKAE